MGLPFDSLKRPKAADVLLSSDLNVPTNKRIKPNHKITQPTHVTLHDTSSTRISKATTLVSSLPSQVETQLSCFNHKYAKMYRESGDVEQLLRIVKLQLAQVVVLLDKKDLPAAESCLKQIWCVLSLVLAFAPHGDFFDTSNLFSDYGSVSSIVEILYGFRHVSKPQSIHSPAAPIIVNHSTALFFLALQYLVQKITFNLKSKIPIGSIFTQILPTFLSNSEMSLWILLLSSTKNLQNLLKITLAFDRLFTYYTKTGCNDKSIKVALKIKIMELQLRTNNPIDTSLLQDNEFLSSAIDQYYEDLYKASEASLNLEFYQQLHAHRSSKMALSIEVDDSSVSKESPNPKLLHIDHELRNLKSQEIKSFKQLDSLTIKTRDFCSIDNNATDFNLIKDIITTIFEISSTFNQYSRIKNVSNLMFNLGFNSVNEHQVLESWTICVAYELCLLESFPDQRKSAYERFTLKIARIGNALYERKFYHNSMTFLKKYLLAFQNFYNEETLNQIIPHLLLKILKADNTTIDSLMEDKELLDNSKANIYVELMQLLSQSKNAEDKLALFLTQSINITSYSEYLRCVYAFYSISGVYVDEIPVKVCPVGLPIDSLRLSGILTQKLYRETWSDQNLEQALSYFHAYFDGKPINENILEQEVVLMLSALLRCNGLHLQNIDLMEYFSHHRDVGTWNWNLVASLSSSYVSITQHESAKALINQHSKNQDTQWKIIAYEYCISQEQIDIKISNSLDKDIQNIMALQSSNARSSLSEKIKNLLIASKFYVLKSQHDILENNYPEAYEDSRFAIKILVSIARKIGNTYPNRMFTELKMESSQLLSLAYSTILECLINSGVLFEFEYYIREYSIFNESLTIGLPLLTLENLTQISYFKLLLMDYEGAWCSLSKLANTASALRPYKLWYKLKSSMLIKHMVSRRQNDLNCTMIGPKELIWSFRQINDENFELAKKIGKEAFVSNAVNLEFVQSLITINNEGSSIEAEPNFLRLQILKKVMGFKNQLKGSYKPYSSTIPSLKEFSTKPYVPRESFELYDELFNFISNIMNSNISNHFHNYELSHFVDLASQALIILHQLGDHSSNYLSVADQISTWRDRFRTVKFTNQRHFLATSTQLQSKNISQKFEFQGIQSRIQNLLPNNMVVVSVDFDTSSNSLIFTKFTKGCKNLFIVNKLLDDQNTISFQQCLDSIDHIIAASNQSTKAETTSKVTSRQLRKEWWKLRFGLDDQLKTLLNTAEHDWLGGITGIFNNIKDDNLLNEIELALSQALGSTASLHPEFLNLIASGVKYLELQDGSFENFCDRLASFLIEPRATNAKLHKRAIKMRLQVVIENHQSQLRKLLQQLPSHVVLIPGKSCSRVPWESMDCLRFRSVSRMPSIFLLMDLLERDHCEVLNNNLHYIINPEGDLKKTQQNFEDKFKSMRNWNGTVGRKPERESFILSVFQSSAFVYLGHGGCEQFLNSSTMLKRAFSGEQLPPSLLIGCSSGSLSSNGLMDESGYVYNWLSGGSPMVLVNLWDVTDKDIDAFSANLFEEWGMFANTGWLLKMSLSEAVCESRDSCTLKYLNGAAPVVYGVPLYINSD